MHLNHSHRQKLYATLESINTPPQTNKNHKTALKKNFKCHFTKLKTEKLHVVVNVVEGNFFAYERSEKRNEIFNFLCCLKLKRVFHTTKQQLFPETVSSLAGEREETQAD